MSIQINIGDHASTEAGYGTFPVTYRANMNWSRVRAKSIAKTMASANTYFKTLPDGKSLTQLLGDRSIWINYHPTMPYYGEAVLSGKELAISRMACRIGKWTMLATLIHELAHINGAPGGASKKAEEALLACGLGRRIEFTTGVDIPDTPYDPGISG